MHTVNRIFSILVMVFVLRVLSSTDEDHQDNWAVLVSTSRYWFNYRHTSNALSLYQQLKRLGIPDSRIILMLPEETACNPRNKEFGSVFSNPSHAKNMYTRETEVDYKGDEVTPESFLRLLIGRQHANTPSSRRLQTTRKSKILIYLTGHGGDQFIKFQDKYELSASDLANAFHQMHLLGRYNEILFIADTCQAVTLYEHVSAPNILMMGSSQRGENSYSIYTDRSVGVSLMDRFTDALQTFLSKHKLGSNRMLMSFWNSLSSTKLQSNPGFRDDLFGRNMSQVRIDEFFSDAAFRTKLIQNKASTRI